MSKEKNMKEGDLVKVKTKFYGEKLGMILEVNKDGVLIKPQNHPRNIIANPRDVTILVST
jgi:transcription elongation factor